MSFLSIGFRMLVNVEALNMIESVGNVVRHRVAPMIVRKGTGEYIMRWVPAISGECLAHAYQSFLAELAQKKELKVCYWCTRNEFIKHFDLNFYKLTSNQISYSSEEVQLIKYLEEKSLTLENARDIEEAIIKCCVVEDIGGFLVTQGPVKRTARFHVSYAVPTYDTVEKGIVALDHQFMVRHAPEAELRRQSSKEIPPAQAPYYPQVGSALYAWIFNLDVDGIGISSISGKPILDAGEAKRRKELALDALAEMLDGKLFGAKLTRFTPFIDFEVAVAAVSDKVRFTVSPPVLNLKRFMLETINRANRAREDTGNAEIEISIWCKDEDVKKVVEETVKEKAKIIATSSIRDFIADIKRKAIH
jgi:CRISPR-associated protein Csa2